MTKNKQTDEPLAFNAWWCATCIPQGVIQEMTLEEMRAHLREAHHIDMSTVKGSKSLTAHVDASKWFQSDYHIVVKDPAGKEIQLHNSVRCARRGFDAQMWADPG